jgi:hypothetical protein
MAAVRSIRNQYLGINAHLHSFWQATGTWNRFHNAQITHLMETMRAELLPLGYVAEIEESLQVRRVGGDAPTRPKADIVVYDPDPRRAGLSPSGGAATLTVADLLTEEETEHPYFAVAIHPLTPDLTPGEAVAWIELLSPTNKGRSQDAATYLGKRRALLDSGLVFVEIDYLHETPPTFSPLLDYSDPTERERGAQPYRIVVLDPRPDLRAGPASIQQFAVDEAIATATIPLSGDDRLAFDFGLPYRRMFEQGLYGYNLDYAALPLHFDRYSAEDQRRIVLRMLATVEAAHAGNDLEHGPFPTSDLDLDNALARIAALATGE